jgi:transcriptional regulator with XRE-family HTH domain
MKNSNKENATTRAVFARNLTRYVASFGVKQKHIAQAVGVTPATFCDWMKGRSYPRIEKIQMLADYFGIQKSDLVEDPNAEERVSPEEQKIMDLFHKVPEEKREFVLSLIQAAIDNL